MLILLVGCGRMGRNWLRVLTDMGHRVDVVDPSFPALACGAWGWRPDMPVTGHYDAAVICTPAHLLTDYALAADTVTTRILVEKPYATTLADAQTLHRLNCIPGFIERYNPAVRALKDTLPSIGRIHHVAARRLGPAPERDTPGLALELAIHDLDVLSFLGLDPGVMIHQRDSGQHYIATLSICGGGARATLEASYLCPYKSRSLVVHGEGGMLVMNYQSQSVALHQSGDGIPVELLPTEPGEPLRVQAEEFLNDTPACTGADAMRALRLLGVGHSATERVAA